MQATIANRNMIQAIYGMPFKPANFGSGSPTYMRPAPGCWTIAIPIWQAQLALGLLLLICLVKAWRSRAGYPSDHCQKCGYSRAGLTDKMPCPECGTRTSCLQAARS